MSSTHNYATLASYCTYLIPVLPGKPSFLDGLQPEARKQALVVLSDGLSSHVPREWEHLHPGTDHECWFNHATGQTQVAHPVDDATRARLLALSTLDQPAGSPPSAAHGAAPLTSPLRHSPNPIAARLHEAAMMSEGEEHAREMEAVRAAHRRALATLSSEAESMLLTAERNHAATVGALQEEHRKAIEGLRSSHAATIETLASAHAAAVSRLEGSLGALRDLERERNAELDAAAAARSEAVRVRATVEAESEEVRRAAAAVEEAVGVVEDAVHGYVTGRSLGVIPPPLSTSTSTHHHHSPSGEGGVPGLMQFPASSSPNHHHHQQQQQQQQQQHQHQQQQQYQQQHQHHHQHLSSPEGGSKGRFSLPEVIHRTSSPTFPPPSGFNSTYSSSSSSTTPASTSATSASATFQNAALAAGVSTDGGRRVMNVSRALPRPMPSPPSAGTSSSSFASHLGRGPAWYAARAEEELARCGLFEEGLEMQRGELAAGREALAGDYRRFKGEVEEVGRLEGSATVGATARARQAVLRLQKVGLEGRIRAQNEDMVAWNAAADFARDRWVEARALAREAGAVRFSEEACRGIEERLRQMDNLEVAAVARQAYFRGAGASMGATGSPRK